MKISRHQKFGTYFTIAVIIIAFLDEAMTFQLGDIFITPFKVFSIYASIIFFKDLELYAFQRKQGLIKSFNNLYLYVIVSLILSSLVDGSLGVSTIERIIHFFSSIFIILIIYAFLKLDKINFSKISNVLICIFYIDLFVALLEIILQKSLINFGIVKLSPLQIRGFHGDRIYLVEYLFIGVMLLHYKKVNIMWFYFVLILTAIVVVSSGSNTGLILLTIGFCYIVYRMKNKAYKTILFSGMVMLVLYINVIRQSTLTESELREITVRDESYYNSDELASNWRLFAFTKIADDVFTNPTFFGHGYEANQDFLEKKSANFTKMKAHSFIAIFYDYGIIGAIFILITMFWSAYGAAKFFFIKSLDIKYMLGFVFSILLLSRLIFYYHTTVVWIYILAVPLIAYFLNTQKKKI